MDAANILKPALARGLLRCIGATTIDEFTKHIATDPALERRLQSVTVREPSEPETIAILQGIKKYYEHFHHATITDDAIEAAARLSGKYVHDQFFPDKAIDLIDEAAAAARTKRAMSAPEKTLMDLKQALAQAENDKETAILNEAFDQAMCIKQTIAALKQDITAAEQILAKAKSPARQRVTEKEVLQALSNKLNIDAALLAEDDWQRLETLPARLHEHIIGQDEAIRKVVGGLRHAQLGLHRVGRPFASFLFAGPSGVGKTALGKALAETLYHDDKALIKFDMSEFAESHSISKLLGSPAGYVGFQERNRFTDSISKRPYSIILFDEFDKAHADVRRLLLQILDEGELTDSRGKHISFQHAIIILTTNTGSELYKSSGIGFGGSATQQTAAIADAVMARLKEDLGNELVGRVSNVCIFSPLEQAHLEAIVRKQITSMNQALREQQRFSIAPDQMAIQQLAIEHASVDLGARHLAHAVEHVVEELLASVLSNAKPRKKTYRLTKTASTYKLT
jgi:ATP-dependent Clp protease ATP-binding subunit ClpC